MRRMLYLLIIAFALVGAWTTPAAAEWETRTGDTVTVNKDEVISGDLWSSSQRVIIEGTVNGDLLVTADEVVVRGEVKGDILGFARRLVINGPVGGDIRILGMELRIAAPVKGNIAALCQLKIGMTKKASAGGLWGTTAQFDGDGLIRDRLKITADRISFGGEVQGDATFQSVGQLDLKAGAKIKNLYYTAPKAPKRGNGVSIGRMERVESPERKQNSALILWSWIWFLGTLMMGFFMIAILPQRTLLWSNTRYGPGTFFRGVALMIFAPIALIFLALTGLGFPLALFIGLFYLIFILYSQLPFYLWFGRRFIRLFRIERNFSPFFSLIVGGLLMAFLTTIPLVGWIANGLATAFGIGMLTYRPSLAGHGVGGVEPPVNDR